MRHLCCEKAAFFKLFRLHLDLDFTFEKIFGLSFKKSGLDLDRKIASPKFVLVGKIALQSEMSELQSIRVFVRPDK